MIKSVYVHIPFCKNICSYCDFCKNYYNKHIIDKYLDALKCEIYDNYKGEKLNTIYVGGGTPSSLSIIELNKLFKVLNTFNLNSDYEFTFECNYEDITKELLKLLKENRVNRLSIGIQTFNEKYSKLLNRSINKDKMINSILLAKEYFDNISIDLMYGLDEETIDELKDDLKTIISLDINHISTYCLILEEHTMLYINEYQELSSDIQSNMYDVICDILKDNNYIHYEVSNFAKKGYYCKHNMTYWNNNKYYGFGLGASGYINHIRYINTKNINKYINNSYIYECEYIDSNTKLKEEIMLLLRTKEGINIKLLKERYGMDLLANKSVLSMISDNLLKIDGNNIYIPEKNFFISNEIILKLFEVCDIM